MCLVPSPVTEITTAAAQQNAAWSVSPDPHNGFLRVTQKFSASTNNFKISEKLFMILLSIRKFCCSDEAAESQGLSLRRAFLCTVCFQAALTAEVHGLPVSLMH